MPQPTPPLPPDRQSEFTFVTLADSPTLRLRWFVGIAVVVPVLVATGVFWLHSLPGGTTRRIATDGTTDVNIITPAETIGSSQENIIQPSPPRPRPAPPVAAAHEVAKLEMDVPAAPVPASPAQSSASGPSAIKTPRHGARGYSTSVFERVLFSHIARYQAYPNGARRDRLQGEVQVLFSMRRDGEVTDMEIATSSGYTALDEAALDTIRRAEPLPRIPADLPDNLSVVIPIAFDMH